MKHISEITPELLKAHQQRRKSEPASKETVSRIWLIMANLFGHKWTSSYGADVDPDGVWRAALKGVSDDKVKEALNLVADSGAEWPPSAPEFRKLCVFGLDNREQAAFKKQAMMNKGLPIKPASIDFAKDAIKKARDKLNK